MRRLLIIEDDTDTLDVLGEFSGQFNFESILRTELPSPQELAELNPDLVLLDHWLGEQLGGNFCGEIKSNPLTNHIPIVLMSAFPHIGRIALDNCADGSINKPFDLDQIQEIFEVYLG